MTIEVVEGKRTFKIIIDITEVTNNIDRVRAEEGLCKVYTDKASSQVEIDGDCDTMMQIVMNLLSENQEHVQTIVKDQPRKANGTFRKGGVQLLHNGTYTSVLWEDSYCYATSALRAKALSDTEIRITVETERNTW